jgi:hypothetical protein
MTEQWTADASTLRREAAKPLTQIEIEQRVFDLYDEYCHGHIDRREFLSRAAAVTIGGLAMAQALLPRYARAQTISFTDPRIKARYVSYPSRPGRLYRDAECVGLVGLGGGSGRPVWVYGCLAEKTFERMRELKVPFDQR